MGVRALIAGAVALLAALRLMTMLAAGGLQHSPHGGAGEASSPRGSGMAEGRLKVLALVVGRRDGRAQRDAVRRSWGAALRDGGMEGFRLRFVVGGSWCRFPHDLQNPGDRCKLKRGTKRSVADRRVREHEAWQRGLDFQLDDESVVHGDLQILPGVMDAYGNLAEKVLYALATNAESADWLLKVDDDVVVRPEALRDLVRGLEARRGASELRIAGFVERGAVVVRKGRWGEKLWRDREYPPYPRGGAGYLMSRQVALALRDAADSLPRHTCEDAAIGMWVSRLKLPVEFVSDGRFDARCGPECCVRTARTGALRGDPVETSSVGIRAVVYGHDFTPESMAACVSAMDEAARQRKTGAFVADGPFVEM